MVVCVSGEVFGKVQGVMFRQTFIRALLKRNLKGGATNDKSNAKRVSFSLEGPKELVDEVTSTLASGKVLNSWGAQVDIMNRDEKYTNFKEHEVTTENVDNYKWTQGVEFYL